MGIVEQVIPHEGREPDVAVKGIGPLGERQNGGQDHGAAHFAFGDDLKEQVGLVLS